jgi:hypothetical protein
MGNEQLSMFILALLVVFFFSLSGPISALAQGTRIDLDLTGTTLSANIKEASLANVIEEVKKETDIRSHKWLKGSESLFSKEVSVRFQSLPVDEGIGRIFLGINHAIVYEGDSVVGVTLFGKARTTRRAVGRRGVSRRRRGVRRTSRR